MAPDVTTENIRDKNKISLTRGKRSGQICSRAKKPQVEKVNQGSKIKNWEKSKQKKNHTKNNGQGAHSLFLLLASALLRYTSVLWLRLGMHAVDLPFVSTPVHASFICKTKRMKVYQDHPYAWPITDPSRTYLYIYVCMYVCTRYVDRYYVCIELYIYTGLCLRKSERI